MTENIIDIQNARVFRRNYRVFENLNLQIKQGEHTAILGPNGAGKTTLLKLLTREVYPVVRENSSIKLFGDEKIELWKLREKIGVVSHEYQNNYLALASGLDVVLSAFFGSVGLHEHNVVTDELRQKALEHMASLNILYLKEKQYLQLSAGQQRRLLLARATIHKPQVLIFDEPTSGLDVNAAFSLINDIRNFIHQGGSLILVTHHIDEIVPEIERVIVLKDGKIIKNDEKSKVLTDDILSNTFDIPLQVTQTNGFYRWSPA